MSIEQKKRTKQKNEWCGAIIIFFIYTTKSLKHLKMMTLVVVKSNLKQKVLWTKIWIDIIQAIINQTFFEFIFYPTQNIKVTIDDINYELYIITNTSPQQQQHF